MHLHLDQLPSLFAAFFKIGAFTFGGGYAMIPLVQKEVVENRQWITDEDILDIVAIAESTPGPIAINAATFVGYKVAGFWGALAATLGVTLPSFLIIAVIAGVLKQVESLEAVKFAFNGVRAGVLALIVKALVSMFRQCPRDWFSLTVAGASFAAVVFLDASVLWVIAACAAAGIAFSILARRRADHDPS